jgi:uncharacterized protein DUF1524
MSHRTTGTLGRARPDRGASLVEWGGALLLIAAITGVLASSAIPGVVATRTEAAICTVFEQAGCAEPPAAGQAAAERPAEPREPAGDQAGDQVGPAPAAAAVGDAPAARKKGDRPEPSSEETARERLGDLKVAEPGDDDGYDREKFPHWADQDDSCDTREAVLKRDGDGVKTASDCYPTSGSWYSPYDDKTWDDPSDIDIDHMVPLAEAWRSGAWAWTTAQRQAYANDLGGPELWAVTDNVNQAKGDKDPAEWLPSRTAFRCTYARAWIQVKWYYNLTVDSAEKSTLTTLLNAC